MAKLFEEREDTFSLLEQAENPTDSTFYDIYYDQPEANNSVEIQGEFHGKNCTIRPVVSFNVDSLPSESKKNFSYKSEVQAEIKYQLKNDILQRVILGPKIVESYTEFKELSGENGVSIKPYFNARFGRANNRLHCGIGSLFRYNACSLNVFGHQINEGFLTALKFNFVKQFSKGALEWSTHNQLLNTSSFSYGSDLCLWRKKLGFTTGFARDVEGYGLPNSYNLGLFFNNPSSFKCAVLAIWKKKDTTFSLIPSLSITMQNYLAENFSTRSSFGLFPYSNKSASCEYAYSKDLMISLSLKEGPADGETNWFNREWAMGVGVKYKD